MEAKDYYRAFHSEVTEWKSKVHDLVGKFEDVPEETKSKLGPFFDELRCVMEAHSDRMGSLEEEFPAEWRPPKNERGGGSFLRRLGRELTKYRVWHLRHL